MFDFPAGLEQDSFFVNRVRPKLLAIPWLKTYLVTGNVKPFVGPGLIHQTEANGRITYLGAAVNNQIQDLVIKINVDNDQIQMSAVSLAGTTLRPLSDYSADYWRQHLTTELEELKKVEGR